MPTTSESKAEVTDFSEITCPHCGETGAFLPVEKRVEASHIDVRWGCYLCGYETWQRAA